MYLLFVFSGIVDIVEYYLTRHRSVASTTSGAEERSREPLREPQHQEQSPSPPPPQPQHQHHHQHKHKHCGGTAGGAASVRQPVYGSPDAERPFSIVVGGILLAMVGQLFSTHAVHEDGLPRVMHNTFALFCVSAGLLFAGQAFYPRSALLLVGAPGMLMVSAGFLLEVGILLDSDAEAQSLVSESLFVHITWQVLAVFFVIVLTALLMARINRARCCGGCGAVDRTGTTTASSSCCCSAAWPALLWERARGAHRATYARVSSQTDDTAEW